MSLTDDKIIQIANAEELFKEELKELDEGLVREIFKIYSRMVVGGVVTFNAEELSLLEDNLIASIKGSNYKFAVDSYIGNFQVLEDLNKLIHKEINDIDVSALLEESTKIKGFLTKVQAQLRGQPTYLLDGIPQRNTSLDELISPITNIIREDAIMGVTFESAAERITDAIESRELGLSRWAGQISRDALSQSDGLQQEEIRKEFRLPYMRYNGTIKKTTRPICYHLITQKPVIKFDELQTELNKFIPNGVPSESTTTQTANGKPQKKGSGMIPGTNSKNFAPNKGGYNCRHVVTFTKKP